MRFGLTALGMVIGTASLILVVTIGLTGKQYILTQIRSIGVNMIQAYYAGASDPSTPAISSPSATCARCGNKCRRWCTLRP